jgi:adenosylcobinamide-GDP ribazoletransferase
MKTIKQQLHYYFLAQSFLSRFPIPKQIEYSHKNMGRAVLYYPVVGLLIGIILASFASVFSFIDHLLLAAILTSIWAAVTGALHLDGLADSADAWLGGHGDKQRIFTIMQDPRSGTAGVVALVLILLLKVILLSLLLQYKQYFLILMIPIAARFSAVTLLYLLPAAKDQGLAYIAKASLPSNTHLYLVITTIILSILMPLSMLLTLAVMIYVLKYMMMQQIGGMTGDTLGASIEIIEMVGLLSAYLVLLSSHAKLI